MLRCRFCGFTLVRPDWDELRQHVQSVHGQAWRTLGKQREQWEEQVDFTAYRQEQHRVLKESAGNPDKHAKPKPRRRKYHLPNAFFVYCLICKESMDRLSARHGEPPPLVWWSRPWRLMAYGTRCDPDGTWYLLR